MESNKCIIIAMGCLLMVTVAMATPASLPFLPLDNSMPCINDVAKVEVTLYYEALCGGCQYFIKNSLEPSLDKILGIMNVTLLPYGNAEETREGDKWKFSCQHGPRECTYNILESCAIHYQPDFVDHFPFLFCVEENISTDWKVTLEKCASKIKTPKETLEACTTGPIGNQAEHHTAMQTGPHDYVPFVLINGKEMKFGTNFVKAVCDAYTGPKPAACKS